MKSSMLLLCAVATLQCCGVGGVPHGLVKRSDDPQPLEAVVMQHSSDLDEIKAQLSALQTKLNTVDGHVAFFAQFSASHITTPTSGPFRFDSVLLNDGDGYDPMVGVFTAPVSGVYAFTVQFFTDGAQSARPLLDIKVNGNTHVRMAFDADADAMAMGSDSDSSTFWTKLQAGDKVWAASAEGHVSTWWGVYHTFFSGALQYAV